MLSLHIVGLILWMGGLFMLTRHVGMHVEQPNGPQEPLKVYESKSYYMGVLPGFLLTLATGLYALIQNPAIYMKADGVWGATFHAKLTLVFVLIVADQLFHLRMRRFHHKGDGSRKLFMAIHGIVGLCFIVIVFLMKGRYLA
jgi:uncharacterized membrane protein